MKLDTTNCAYQLTLPASLSEDLSAYARNADSQAARQFSCGFALGSRVASASARKLAGIVCRPIPQSHASELRWVEFAGGSSIGEFGPVMPPMVRELHLAIAWLECGKAQPDDGTLEWEDWLTSLDELDSPYQRGCLAGIINEVNCIPLSHYCPALGNTLAIVDYVSFDVPEFLIDPYESGDDSDLNKEDRRVLTLMDEAIANAKQTLRSFTETHCVDEPAEFHLVWDPAYDSYFCHHPDFIAAGSMCKALRVVAMLPLSVVYEHDLLEYVCSKREIFA